MSKFELKTLSLDLVDIPPIYSLWDLSKKVGKSFGESIFRYYRNFDPTVFDKKETKKRFYDTSKWYYYYKLEKIIKLSQIWHYDKKWGGAIIVEPSSRDPRGKQRYVVHSGSDRVSIMRSYAVENYEFLLLNDRSSVVEDDLEEIKTFYNDNLRNTIYIFSNPKDGLPMIQSSNDNWLKDQSYPNVKRWIESKLDFWEFVKS